jgi:hypothetical protein
LTIPIFAAKLLQKTPLLQEDGLRKMARLSSGTRMRDFLTGAKAVAAVAMLAPAVIGCGSSQLTEIGNVSLLPRVGQLARPDWLTYSGAKNEFALRAITAADLVNEDGQCAMATPDAQPAPAAGSDPTPQPALQPGGIALQMTECDVVRRVGAPEQLQIGVEQGERSVVITYIRGPRPGIYRFAAGRLTSIERVPEAPGAKAAPKAKPSNKAARS